MTHTNPMYCQGPAMIYEILIMLAVAKMYKISATKQYCLQLVYVYVVVKN